jgi:hypothetical protein
MSGQTIIDGHCVGEQVAMRPGRSERFADGHTVYTTKFVAVRVHAVEIRAGSPAEVAVCGLPIARERVLLDRSWEEQLAIPVERHPRQGPAPAAPCPHCVELLQAEDDNGSGED